MTAPALVQKLRNYCNILQDDGLSYSDYVEQLTYLLFFKMADEQSRPPFKWLQCPPCASLPFQCRGWDRHAPAPLTPRFN